MNTKFVLATMLFSTLSLNLFAHEASQFTDERDGKVYKIVKIRKQIWMAENLAYKPEYGNYWAYKNDESDILKDGYLYDWEAANDVCPNGWRLPAKDDFITLLDNTGSGDQTYHNRLLPSRDPWFSNQFGGWRLQSGRFLAIEKYTIFWSSTSSDETTKAWKLSIGGYRSLSFLDLEYKNCGLSVRCIYDN